MKAKLLALIIGLQSAWVLGTALIHEEWREDGQVILLETRPVDPRDLLRGDYVILNYEISDVSSHHFVPPVSGLVEPGKTVYVALEKRGEFHEVTRASFSGLKPRDNEVLLRGRTGRVVRGGPVGGSVRVLYGLEQFFVREGTGNPTGKLTVQVAVTSSGRGIIKQVFVNGIPYAEAMRNP